MVQVSERRLQSLSSASVMAFAQFIESSYIREFSVHQVQMARELNIPLLRFFGGLSEQQILEITEMGVREFIGALAQGDVEQFIAQQKQNWINELLPSELGMRKTDIQMDDVLLVSYIRKTTMMRFAPTFCADMEQYHKLSAELDRFFINYDLEFTDLFLYIHNEQKVQKSQLEEREERLNMAIEVTGLGTWDYYLVTGKILASESYKKIFGLSQSAMVTFDNFLETVEDTDRAYVISEVSAVVNGEKPEYEAEYRIRRGTDGELRWVSAKGKLLRDDLRTPVRLVGTVLDITEKKQAAERIRNSEQQYRQLADFMPQLIWEAEKNGNVIYFNKQWIDYTGTTTESKSRWGVLVHPDDVPQSKLLWEQSLATGISYETEYRLKNVDGNYRWFLARAYPVRDEEGNVLKWYGTCTDIHEQKLADESLQLQARVLESMDEGVSISDETGIILYTNPAEDRLFGYEPGELNGLHVSIQNAYSEEENVRIVDKVINQLKTKGTWNGQWYNRRKDGSTFYTYARISLLTVGNKNYFVCVQRDITEEKRTKEILEESEQRFRTLADNAPMFVWMADEKANITYCNKELLSYIGYNDYREVTGKVWETVTHKDDVPALYNIYANAFSNPVPFSIEVRFKGVNGNYKWFLFKGAPRVENEQFAGFIGTAIDIDEQRTLNQELERRVSERTEALQLTNAKLEQSNKELEQFAYVASHDLQEPLRKIQSLGDILVARAAGDLDKDGIDVIRRMQVASARMKSLIDDLLTFSRVSAVKDTPRQIKLNSLIQEVLDDVETTIQEQDAHVTVDNLGTVYGNELQLRQLFQNLISNSLKFRKRETAPYINVTSAVVKGKESGMFVTPEDEEKQFRLIEISDNGIGFDPQYATRIFELFNRLHGKTEYKGTGIGLAIAKKVVEKHHGYISADARPGEGATFTILLPCKA